MRAVVISRPGGPEVLELKEIPEPTCGPEQLLVKIRATALNRADLLQRRGLYPAPEDAPQEVPGLEFAGEVELKGAEVRGFEIGERVMGILGGGGYAEKVVLHQGLCMKIPSALSCAEAAAVPEAFLTAYDALYRQAKLRPEESLLVQAAGSGVGTAALQLAAVEGVRVIGLSRSAAKRRRLEKLGAGPVFDSRAENLAEMARRWNGGEGFDVILDMIGASAWPLHCRLLRSRGRMVIIGLMGGARCEIDLALLLRNRWTILGSVMRSRRLEEKIELTADFTSRMMPLLESGRLRPCIDRTLDISRVAEAHAAMERNENLGKIVLTLERE
jgi:putative PIG3 family NAD(P)H quinone oxidoreductase